jgi:hypothetical protein
MSGGSVALTTRYPLSANLALSSPTSGDRSVGIVRLRTKGHGVYFFFSLVLFVGTDVRTLKSHKFLAIFWLLNWTILRRIASFDSYAVPLKTCSVRCNELKLGWILLVTVRCVTVCSRLRFTVSLTCTEPKCSVASACCPSCRRVLSDDVTHNESRGAGGIDRSV